MSVQQQPTIAVLGTGYWGQNLVRNYHELGALHTVCDINQEALDQVRSRYPGVGVTDDFQQVLQDPAIRAVVIALPAVMHYKFAREALLAGKDVYVEKPLALDVKEAQELVKLADKQQQILMVGHLLQYHPCFQKLKEMAQTGELGRIQYIYSNRLSLGKIRREENSLWSFAPHDVSMILALANEMPIEVVAHGSSYLQSSIADVTTTHLRFANGINAHIFVSWLHPFKEHKLIVVADRLMAVFEDSEPWERKLAIYPHRIKWQNGAPIPEKSEVEYIQLPPAEPLRQECLHFLSCLAERKTPLSDGREGLRVLQVLNQAQDSLSGKRPEPEPPPTAYFAHPSAYIDEPCEIGEGTKIWHFSHILKGAKIGRNCSVGQNVSIANDVQIGDNVKIQNNVSVYQGTIVESDVFLGPSCVLTNVTNPRSQVNRRNLYERTVLRRGCTVGANATVVCGIEIGRYAFIAAGALVAKNVADYALMVGVPARHAGWMSRHGHRLQNPDQEGIYRCAESGYRYTLRANGTLHCLDLPEDEALPPEMAVGAKNYDEFKLPNQAIHSAH